MKLKDVGIIVTGNTPSKSNKEFYESKDINFFKPSDIDEKYIDILNKSEEYISEKARNKARILPRGSVLMTCIGTIGKIGILNCEASCNQQINAIIPNENINSKYLAYSLLSQKKYFQKKANAPVVPIINKTDFSEFEIKVVKLNEQLKIVEKLDRVLELIKLRVKQLNALDEIVKSQFVEHNVFNELGVA